MRRTWRFLPSVSTISSHVPSRRRAEAAHAGRPARLTGAERRALAQHAQRLGVRHARARGRGRSSARACSGSVSRCPSRWSFVSTSRPERIAVEAAHREHPGADVAQQRRRRSAGRPGSVRVVMSPTGLCSAITIRSVSSPTRRPSTVTRSRRGSMRRCGHAHDLPVDADASGLDRPRAASLREQTPNFESARASERRPGAGSCGRRGCGAAGQGVSGRRIAEGEGHLPLADAPAVDARDALAGCPSSTRRRTTVASSMTGVAGDDRAPVAHAVDAHEVDEPDRFSGFVRMRTAPGLGHRLRQDRGRQHRTAAGPGDEVPLVGGDVLDRRRPGGPARARRCGRPAGTDGGAAGSRLMSVSSSGSVRRLSVMPVRVYPAPPERGRGDRVLRMTRLARPPVQASGSRSKARSWKSSCPSWREVNVGARPGRALAHDRARAATASSTTASSTSSWPAGRHADARVLRRLRPRRRRALRLRAGRGHRGSGRRVAGDRVRRGREPGPALHRDHARRGRRAGDPARAPRPAGGRAQHRGTRRPARSTRRRAPRCRCWPSTWRSPSRTRTFHRETRWYAGLLATLYEIGKETASILDLDELLHRVADVVKRVIDYEMFGILLLDEERRELVLRKSVSYGVDPGEDADQARRGPLRHRRAHQAAHPGGRRAAGPALPASSSRRRAPSSWCRSSPRTAWSACSTWSRPQLDRFNEEHVQVLTALAGQVAVAIENARLYDELVRREMRLHRELSIARDVQHGLFPEEDPSRARAGSRRRTSGPPRELGGDLYDFYDIGEQVLGVAIGDVAGKGVPAALYAAFASGTVRARAFERHPPGRPPLPGQPDPAPARHRGLLLHAGLRPLRLLGAARALSPTPACPTRSTTRPSTGRCVPARGGRAAARGLRRRHLRRDSSSWSPATSSSSTATGSARPGTAPRSTGRPALREQIERHAGLSAPALGDQLVADVDAFLEGRPLKDDLTLVVVKVR